MEKNQVDTGRRMFMGWLTAAALALLGAFAAFVGGGFIFPIKRKKPEPLFVCLKSEVPKTEVEKFIDATLHKSDNWEKYHRWTEGLTPEQRKTMLEWEQKTYHSRE